MVQKKIISQFEQGQSGVFTELIKESGLVCESISIDSKYRPYLFIELSKSQDKCAAEHPLQRSSSKEPYVVLNQPRVKAFISHWFSTWESIEEVEDACRKYGYTTEVLNTTDKEQEGWTNSIPISFFRQVEYACNNFDASFDFMLFITADVQSKDWANFFAYADKVLSLEGLGSFSPSLSAAVMSTRRGAHQTTPRSLPLRRTLAECATVPRSRKVFESGDGRPETGKVLR